MGTTATPTTSAPTTAELRSFIEEATHVKLSTPEVELIRVFAQTGRRPVVVGHVDAGAVR